MHKETRGIVVKLLLTAFKSQDITHCVKLLVPASFSSFWSLETDPLYLVTCLDVFFLLKNLSDICLEHKEARWKQSRRTNKFISGMPVGGMQQTGVI